MSNPTPSRETIRRDYHFTSDMFGLDPATAVFVRLTLICREGAFVVNVTLPNAIPLIAVLALIGEDYLMMVGRNNGDMSTWQCHYLVSGDQVDLECTAEEVAQQLEQSAYNIIVTTNI